MSQLAAGPLSPTHGPNMPSSCRNKTLFHYSLAKAPGGGGTLDHPPIGLEGGGSATPSSPPCVPVNPCTPPDRLPLPLSEGPRGVAGESVPTSGAATSPRRVPVFVCPAPSPPVPSSLPSHPPCEGIPSLHSCDYALSPPPVCASPVLGVFGVLGPPGGSPLAPRGRVPCGPHRRPAAAERRGGWGRNFPGPSVPSRRAAVRSPPPPHRHRQVPPRGSPPRVCMPMGGGGRHVGPLPGSR